MKALVTGGGGFLGGAIVRRLLARGDRVRSFARGEYPELEDLGVEVYRGDLTHETSVREAVRGCDIVFHAGAKPGIWGDPKEFYATNVQGTMNVINACRAEGVSRLVYTSSPSVVFNGQDMEGADETVPYPDHYEAEYPKTKAIAERLLLVANDAGLATVALRPHLIWGPGDNHLVPRILARAKSLRVIGDGMNKVDTVYIDNAAQAHLLAADRLSPGSPIAGKAYFITQGKPMPLWEIINKILSAGGKPPARGRISKGAAVAIGAALESAYRLLRLPGEPRMTRFLAHELSTAHWFDISAARRDLGYEPEVSFEEGMERLAAWLREKETHE